jgi:hypothetical protein
MFFFFGHVDNSVEFQIAITWFFTACWMINAINGARLRLHLCFDLMLQVIVLVEPAGEECVCMTDFSSDHSCVEVTHMDSAFRAPLMCKMGKPRNMHVLLVRRARCFYIFLA